MASFLMLSFLIKAKFRRKLRIFLEYILLASILATVKDFKVAYSYSVLPAPLQPLKGSSCGDVLCLHGVCKDGRCVCDRGWQGSACHRCGGRVRLTGPQGYISDGISNYSTDLQCTWLIDSGNKDSIIRLQFIEFETECSWDHLYIFDGDSVFAPLVAAFSGLLLKDGYPYQEIPEVVTTSGRAYLYFYSDVAYNMSGFNVSYNINTCPRNCSSHGACIDGICTCDAGWDGPACDVSFCFNDCRPNGRCDRENRRCICHQGYAGVDCTIREADGYWIKLAVTNDVKGRALHQSVVYKESFFVVGGESFESLHGTDDFLLRYDFQPRKWNKLNPIGSSPSPRFGHSVVLFEDQLYMYGGILYNGTVVNELWVYDVASNRWSSSDVKTSLYKQCLSDYCSPLPAMGHTANVVENKMIVIFGHNPIFGYLNAVQEYNFLTGKWVMISTRGALVKGGFGHSSVYDQSSKMIYVYGGYHSYGSDSILVDLLYGYDPSRKLWKLLNPSLSPRYLHTAVLMHGLIFVFGGNGHNATHDGAGDKCFSPQFLAYDIDCDTWTIMKDPLFSLRNSANVGRFGHSAVVFENNMYIFGGFNGLMLNSILKYSPGDCSQFQNDMVCEQLKEGLNCVWNDKKRVCQPYSSFKPFLSPSPSSMSSSALVSSPLYSNASLIRSHKSRCGPRNSNFSDLCSKQSTCPSCIENSYGCVWCGDSCHYQKCVKAGMKAISDSSMCDDDVLTSNCDKLHNCHSCHTEYHCGWQRDHKCYTFIRDVGNKTQKAVIHDDFRPNCDIPCHERTSCENCTQGQCMWCSSSQRCIESNAYAAVFPISQCMEWTIHNYKCPSLSCSEIQTCDKCQKNPRCGWCDDGSGTGIGVCLEGSSDAPYIWNGTKYTAAPNACKSSNWHFTSCPKCQCNGHSTCQIGTNTCQKPCRHLTEGSHCQYCMAGYYGNPINGGNCTSCFCHNHSVFCNRDTGKCHCTTKGIVGHNCDRCDEGNHYFGNPTEEGGSCYYNLTIDFQYTFNMSKVDDRYYTRINFMNVPSRPDIDVEFQVSCSENAYVNISIGSATLPIRTLFERQECGQMVKLRFNHDENLFGVENTTFYVNVFGFSTPFVLQISFSQHRTLDLLQFFVTFSSCFLSLLIVAAILWKIKQKYDMYRRRQQLFLEMEHMASRPFAGIVIDLDSPVVHGSNGDLASLKRNNPTPIALEPCSGGKAAVLTLILRLPTGGSNSTPPSQTGLAIASALVSLGVMDQKLSKETDNSSTGKTYTSSVKCSNATANA